MFVINKIHIDDMIDHAVKDDPNECCGILVGNNGVVDKVCRMTNMANSPYRYDMDSGELLKILDDEHEIARRELVAIYHSHTHSQAYPSNTDVRLAPTSFFPDAYYVLVSLLDKENPTVRAFRIENGEVQEEDVSFE